MRRTDHTLIAELAAEAKIWPGLLPPLGPDAQASSTTSGLNAHLLDQWATFAGLVAEECAKVADELGSGAIARAVRGKFGTGPGRSDRESRVADATSAKISLPLTGYVLPVRAAQATGLTVAAIRGKIDQGVWVEGREWIKGPDGHRYISMTGYAAWVERGRHG